MLSVPPCMRDDGSPDRDPGEDGAGEDGAGEGGGAGPFVGADGLAMLALSCLLILVSVGLSFLASLIYVLLLAARAGTGSAAGQHVVVLGMRLAEDGSIPPTYQTRLERARAIHARQPALDVVLLGGAARPGGPSEADAGRCYLAARGMAVERVRIEDRSRHTLENLRLYRERIGPDPGGSALLVTSRFHLARATLLARGLGIRHRPCAAEERFTPRGRDLPRLLWEALLIHWYVTGRGFARITGNKRMTARVR